MTCKAPPKLPFSFSRKEEMDARNKVVSDIGDLLWNEDKKLLAVSYTVLKILTEYIEAEPVVEKEKLLSLLRNITSNIQMIHGYRHT
jgi:hypothetical protein